MRIFVAGNSGPTGPRPAGCSGRARAGRAAICRSLISLTTSGSRVTRSLRSAPDVVINAAAYTDTAGCERDPDLAYRANALGVQSLALACAAAGAALLHISTNEVFDGRQTTPYRELDAANPLNTYARSKLAGEWYAQTLRAALLHRAHGLALRRGHKQLHPQDDPAGR